MAYTIATDKKAELKRISRIKKNPIKDDTAFDILIFVSIFILFETNIQINFEYQNVLLKKLSFFVNLTYKIPNS